MDVTESSFNDMLIETGKSNNILIPYILKTDKYIKSLSKKDLIYPNFRYYESDYNKNNSKYAYVTMIFDGETYLPGIIALGYSLRKVNSKHKLICVIQDKDEYGLQRIKKDKIDEINKIYDLVIGVDIIKIDCKSKYFIKREVFYKNIKYYTTKNNILGLIEYEKIIYIDASSIVNKNLDDIFENYDKSTYKCNIMYNEWDLTNNMGLHGNFLYFIPSIYNYNKFLIFVKEYDDVIGKYYLTYSIDEVMFYYSIYPEWNNDPKEMFDNTIVGRSYKKFILINKEIKYEKFKNDSRVYIYEANKPFRFICEKEYKNTDLENVTIEHYRPFDAVVKNLIKEKPEMLKYFEFIKTFRIVFF